jgi:hypothetical protein
MLKNKADDQNENRKKNKKKNERSYALEPENVRKNVSPSH